jgi:hypothetical protein
VIGDLLLLFLLHVLNLGPCFEDDDDGVFLGNTLQFFHYFVVKERMGVINIV